MEIWKDVKGYELYFKVSNLGRVLGKRSGKILKQHTNKNGRATLATRIGGRQGEAVTFFVHRLVAEAFVENVENKPQVNHKDGNPSNNSVDNLEWVTASENMQHAFDNKLIVASRGVESCSASLSESQVEYIRENPAGKTVRELAVDCGVHHSTIVRCKNKDRY